MYHLDVDVLVVGLRIKAVNKIAAEPVDVGEEPRGDSTTVRPVSEGLDRSLAAIRPSAHPFMGLRAGGDIGPRDSVGVY
jgi:hypothetical protein